MTRAFAIVALAAASTVASADFSSFIIREGGGNPPTIQANNTYVPNATEFIISVGGMKAALGSNDVNGQTLNDLDRMKIVRHDDPTRFTAGSGPAVAPYFNIWITDGLGNFAVVANEPSNPSFSAFRTAGPGNGFTYDFSMADISNEPAKIYETNGWNTDTSWVHVATGKTNATMKFSDLLGFTVLAPDASYITGPNGVGSGAPRELGTNIAYGFNWVFGDTLSNYVSGAEGYVVSGALVPAPASAVLLGLGGLAAARRRRA